MEILKKNPTFEVFVTHVSQGNKDAYRDWASKIQQVEKTFPGYLGVYTQPPSEIEPNNWITILQFETEQHLENWLQSKKRLEILEESKRFVENYEMHRLSNPFYGWFQSILKFPKRISLVIKETMLVLLVLFPIVMLEIRYLNPHLTALNLSLATFIGNAISVSLISFPFMPICLYFFGWWLSQDIAKTNLFKNILGFIAVFALYAIEILIFMLLP